MVCVCVCVSVCVCVWILVVASGVQRLDFTSLDITTIVEYY